ncbi:MAG: hypothetical protein AAFV85_27740 [Cyanobacteria bacterium J06634_6]
MSRLDSSIFCDEEERSQSQCADSGQRHARKCGIEHLVQFQQRELAEIEAPVDSGVLLCNPPYGERLGKDTDLGAFYKLLLGNVLKKRFKGWTAYVLSGNKVLLQNIGLTSSLVSMYNGALLYQLIQHEPY